MASNQQDKNAHERRSGSSSMEFHALGSCTNSGIMKNSVPTSNGTPLATVKCSVPSSSFFSGMVLNSNTSIGPSSINHAMNATKVIDGLVIGRSSGCSSSSSSMSYRPSAIGWNASSIGGGMEGTQGNAQLACDSAFAERAARFSCFGAFNLSEGGFPRSRIDNSVMPKIPKPNANMVEVTKAAGSPPKEEAYNAENGPRKAGRLSRSSTPGGNESDDAEVSTAREDSSSSEHVTGDVTTVGRKRKLMKQLPKDLSASEAGINIKSMEGSEMNYLKYKASEGLVEKDDVKGQGEQSSSKNGKLNASKEDYFHVRAKRGQATNSHSLAERVRREKISERMKFLQDLVPGCSKVTGKAVMLDEIINYVQSLQRQVEFLSMKLAAVNPRLDFNIEALIAKDSRSSLSTMVCPPDSRMSYPHLHQPQHGLLQVGTEGHSVNQAEALRRSVNSQLGCIDGYGDAIAQLSNVWDDELQSIVQMGFGQNISIPFKSQGNSSTIPSGNMKSEL